MRAGSGGGGAGPSAQNAIKATRSTRQTKRNDRAASDRRRPGRDFDTKLLLLIARRRRVNRERRVSAEEGAVHEIEPALVRRRSAGRRSSHGWSRRFGGERSGCDDQSRADDDMPREHADGRIAGDLNDVCACGDETNTRGAWNDCDRQNQAGNE
jgi:hypothetical protein